MPIVKAQKTDLEQCVDILFVPGLGELYYPQRELLYTELEKRISAGEVFIEKIAAGGGITSEPDIQGVIWYQREGLFCSFPYLHMIAVRDECRRQGIGSALMDFYEQDSLRVGKNKIRTRAFLLVSEQNLPAQRFYQGRGYVEVGRFEKLFRRGVTEILLMKKVKASAQ